MKKLLMGAVALAAMSTTPAFAADYQVQGTVNAACYANTGGTIDFTTIGINATTGRLNPNQTASSGSSNVWCNGVNSTLSFSSTNNLTTTNTTSDSNFTSTLTFTPSVKLNNVDIATGTKIGAQSGGLVVTAGNLSDNGLMPVAGNYTGLITVTLTPAA